MAKPSEDRIVSATPSGSRAGPLVLLALNAGLAAVAYWVATADIGPLVAATRPTTVTPAMSNPLPTPAPLPRPVSLTALSETLARPLFRPDRRPYVPPPVEPARVAKAEPPPVEIAPPAVKLLGTLMLGRGQQRALLREGAAPRGTWVEIGGEIAGWRIVAIERAAVEFDNAGRRHVVSLESVRTP